MDILSQIRPNEQERLLFKATTDSFLRQINSQLKDAQAVLGGSGAKDTWLAGNHDADIFVRFNYKLYSSKSSVLPDLLELALKKAFPKEKISRVHGSRDYFQMHYQQFFFEVIPLLKISQAEKAVNITDVSPLHSTWVNRHTKWLKDEVRLLKQFCRAQKCYGAESYVGGFSGYVLEILTAAYGSFKKVLAASAIWKAGTVVDVEQHYRGKNALFELNSSKHSPLIVIDPLDKSRNAAAALTLEKFNLFKEKAGEYLKKPSEKFFEKQELTAAQLKLVFPKTVILYLEVQEQTGKRDVVGSKLLKVFAFLKEKLQPFGLIDAGWDWNKFYFVLKIRLLPAAEERSGPPLALKEAAANFKRKNRQSYVRSGRLFCKKKIKHRSLERFTQELFKGDYFKGKAKLVKTCRVL
ncbi:MAG TPA: nucleotidyltransferase domain-containing protein [Candidatus Nanoarchaeia archaeon]|nr:nucleotidyltransferase domain-containing protein [Candidatus Nanoarchaeia archaeon]